MLDSDYCAGGTQISDRGTGVSATDSEAIEIDRDMVDQYYEAIGTRWREVAGQQVGTRKRYVFTFADIGHLGRDPGCVHAKREHKRNDSDSSLFHLTLPPCGKVSLRLA